MRATQNDSNINQVFAAFLIGAGIGLGVGILFAPNTGRRTRALLAKSADRGIHQIKDRVEELKDRVEDFQASAADLLEKGLQSVQDHKDNVARGVKQLKKTYKEVAG